MTEQNTIATPCIDASELIEAIRVNYNSLRSISDAHQQRLYSENYNKAEEYKRKILIDEIEVQLQTEGQSTRAVKIRRILNTLPLSLLLRGHLSKIELSGLPHQDSDYPRSFSLGDIIETSDFHECVMMLYSFPRGKIKGNVRELWEKYTIYLLIGAIVYGAAYWSEDRIKSGKTDDYTLTLQHGIYNSSGRQFAEELMSTLRAHDDIYTLMKDRYKHLGESAQYYIIGEIVAAYFMGFVMSPEYHFNPLPKALKIRIHTFVHAWLNLPGGYYLKVTIAPLCAGLFFHTKKPAARYCVRAMRK